MPLSGSERHAVTTSLRALRMSTVPSVETPSMTITSLAENVCDAMLSRQRGSWRAALRVAIRMLMRGALDMAAPPALPAQRLPPLRVRAADEVREFPLE